MVESFYDSTAWVAGSSPGADEACSIASLLHLAQYLKYNPPQRTVILIATSGHAQALAGMRDLVWGFTTRSNIQRKMLRELKNLIKKTRSTIKALEQASFETPDTEAPKDEEKQDLVKDPNPFEIVYDLILCRNVIIYFNYELQNKVFKLFLDNMSAGSCLVLGVHESILGPFASRFDKKFQAYFKK